MQTGKEIVAFSVSAHNLMLVLLKRNVCNVTFVIKISQRVDTFGSINNGA